MAKTHVDMSAEKFGSATSIAHLARSTFADKDSRAMTVEFAMRLAERDWRFELDRQRCEMECGVGLRLAFRDGSVLHVAD